MSLMKTKCLNEVKTVFIQSAIYFDKFSIWYLIEYLIRDFGSRNYE